MVLYLLKLTANGAALNGLGEQQHGLLQGGELALAAGVRRPGRRQALLRYILEHGLLNVLAQVRVLKRIQVRIKEFHPKFMFY